MAVDQFTTKRDELMGFVARSEPWCEYELEDGTIIRVRVMLTKASGAARHRPERQSVVPPDDAAGVRRDAVRTGDQDGQGKERIMKTWRLIGVAIWLIALVCVLFWLAPYARAQARQSLCTPFVNTAGNISCIPVGMTGVGTAPYTYNWLPVGGLANAAAPAYTEGRLSGLSFDLSGNLRVLGTFTPSSSSPEFTPVAPATATATKGVLLGGQYDSTQKTLTNGQQAAASFSARGALFVAPGADGFAVTNAGTFATQSAITAASGALASGSVASGAMVDLVALSAPVAPATATATKSALIGCQATSAGINPTTGQQAALDCDLNNNLLVSPGGAPNLTTSQVVVTTSSTAVCPARALRRSCSISTITGTQQVFCSGTTATTANGQIFPAVVGASFPFQTTAAVNCIAVSSSQTVSVVETF